MPTTADLGNVPSAFAPNNLLYDAASGSTLIGNQNALLQQDQSRQLFPAKLQAAQQAVGLTDMDVVSRAAGTLLNMPEDQAAAAYPGMIAELQARGFAKQAPTTYPGHAAVQGLVNRGMTVPEQYQYGIIPMPGMSGAPPLPGQPGYGAGGGGGGGPDPVAAMPREQALDAIAKRESANQNVPNAQGGDASGYWQIRNATWQDGAKLAGIDVAKWPRAMDAPQDVQRQVAGALFDKYGATPWLASSPGYLAGQPPQPPPGAQATPAPYKVATAGAIPPPPSGVAPRAGGQVANADATDLNGPRPLPPVGANAPTPPTPAQLANTPAPGQNALAPPPSAPAAPPPAQAQPPAPVQQQQQPPPATGINSPQYQQAVQLMNQAARYEAFAKMPGPLGAQYAAEAARLKGQAALLMQADSVSVDPNTGIQTKAITGEQLNAANPNAHYVWSDAHNAFIDTTGTHPPVTPRAPALTTTKEGVVLQSEPGGKATVVYRTDPQAVAEQSAAAAQGTTTGTEAAKALPQMVNQARTAAQAEGNIDYGLSQLDKAKAGGINTGYFSGALTEVQAALKSLGLPTDKIPFINVEPGAIGNIQTARKTLAVVSGSILQQIIGPGSPITDSKIEAFIHAQPGIETDPDAVRRVLAWARSQFTYEREMGQAAVKAAGAPTAGGMLPPGWQAQYYDQHGFAPIYNPTLGEMQQPDGGAPGRVSPASTGGMPPLPPGFKVVQ